MERKQITWWTRLVLLLKFNGNKGTEENNKNSIAMYPAFYDFSDIIQCSGLSTENYKLKSIYPEVSKDFELSL